VKDAALHAHDASDPPIAVQPVQRAVGYLDHDPSGGYVASRKDFLRIAYFSSLGETRFD
jgi:hypothetical protein